MKTTTHILATLLLGLTLTQVSAQNNFDDPTGLNTLINTNNVNFEEEVGNIGVADFNALGERLAFTFESEDGYTGNQRVDSIILTELGGSPMDLRLNFEGPSGYRQRDSFFPTGGDSDLVVGASGGTVKINFVDPLNTSNPQPVTGIAFAANRVSGGDMNVSLYSDLARTQQIGSTFTILSNNAGSNHSFFGYFDGNASIASVVIDGTATTAQFSIDDLNISTIPEPSTLIMLLLSACVFLPLYLRRKMRG